MNRSRFESVSAIALSAALGAILGAAIARWLCEGPFNHSTLFYGWPAAVSFAILGAVLLTLFVLLLTRYPLRRATPLAAAIPFLPLSLLAIYVVQRQVNTLQLCVLLVGSLALVGALNAAQFPSRLELDRLALFATFAVALAVYMRTLAPTVGAHDTFEFQALSYELGIPHPTGYPLYILLGKLFTLVPLGNIAFRVNLSSALFAAAAVALLYATLTRLTTLRSVSALAALGFAFSSSFWSQAIEAEVYALNALFVSAICYLLLRGFSGAPDTVPRPPPAHGAGRVARLRAALGLASTRQVTVVAVALIYGVSLTHHRTMLLLGPAVIAYLILNRAWRLFTPRLLIAVLGAFLVPLIGVHLYIPVRWWQTNGQAMTWRQFADLVLGSRFAAALRWDAVLEDPARLTIYLRTLAEQYPVPVYLFAAVGIVYLLWRRWPLDEHFSWKEGVLLLLAFSAYAVFGLSYNVPDVSLFLIPSYLIITIALGIGVAGFFREIDDRLSRTSPALAPSSRLLAWSATITVLALLPLSLIWSNLPRVDRSGARSHYAWGRYVLQQNLPPESVILADSQKMAPLYFLQRVEGVRPDTETGVFPDEESNRTELDRRLSEGRSIFLARFLPGLESTYHLRSLGPLVEVSTAPLTHLPSDLHDLGVEFHDSIVLGGYRLDAQELDRGETLRLTLFWEAQQGTPRNYDVRLRLVGPTGHVWLETKGRPPGGGMYPTAAWRPGEIVPDYHEMDLAGRIPPGRFCLEVGLFAPFGAEGLSEGDAQDGYVSLANVSVSSAKDWLPTIDHPLRANFGDQVLLLGYDLPATAAPGVRIPLTLYWQAVDELDANYDIVLQLATPDNRVVWEAIQQPFFGQYPTSDWLPGEILVETYHWTTTDPTSDPLQLRISLRDPRSEDSLAVVGGWLADRRGDLMLTGPIISGSSLVTSDVDYLPANFQNEILLIDYEIHNVQVRTGDALQLTLTWQTLSQMDENYTVFIHLLDDQDRIWGQEDIEPVHGTYPTSLWAEGEVVVDPHTIWTRQDAPLGLYRVEIGLYLLQSMERLQLLDSSGNAIDDRLIIDLMEIVP
jgi:hypothetical protein